MATKKKRPARLHPTERLANSSELADFRMVEAHLKQATRIGPLPANPQLNAQIETQIVNDETQNLFRVLATLSFVATYDDSTEPAILINAKFQMTFKTSDRKLITKEALGPFAEGPALFMVWPYWREFVSSATGRMSLPRFVVPMLTTRALIREEEKQATSQIQHGKTNSQRHLAPAPPATHS